MSAKVLDLSDEDINERAASAKPEFPAGVRSDSNYLRSDGVFVRRILDSEAPVFNIVAPRRWGKTSFLKRVQRHAMAEGRKVVFASFQGDVSAAVEELTNRFGLKINRDEDWIPPLLSHIENSDTSPLILLDEGNRQIRQDNDDGKLLRRLLRGLAALAVDEDKLTLCIAETAPFFGFFREKADGLELAVAASPIYLGPLTAAVKSAFLSPLFDAGHQELVEKIGNCPIEVQLLRNRFEELNKEGRGKDSEGLNEGFQRIWSENLDLILYSLTPYEKALWLESCGNNLSKERLTAEGNTVMARMADVTGWGLINSRGRKRFGQPSKISEEFIRTKITGVDPSVIKRLFKKAQAIEVKVSRKPQPTFREGFVIHQLADLHYGRLGRKVDKKALVDFYIDLLAQSDGENLPHVIVICGDLTTLGKREEFFDAGEFVSRLKNEANQNGRPLIRPLYENAPPDFNNQIVVVPGNHDVLWPDNTDGGRVGNDGFHSFARQAGCLTSVNKVPAVYIEPVDVTIIACDSAHLSGTDIPLAAIEVPDDLFKDEIQGLIKIVKQIQDMVRKNIINSSSDDHDIDADRKILEYVTRFTWGLVDEEFLKNIGVLVESAKSKNLIPFPEGAERNSFGPEVRIGILHHNLLTFSKISLFTDLVNSRVVRDCFVDNDINIILHGHQHQYSVTSEMVYRSDGNRGSVGKFLHCIGVDSLGVPKPDMLKHYFPTFNEIRIGCNVQKKDSRIVSVKNIPINVDFEQRWHHGESYTSADIVIDRPKSYA